MLGIPIEMWPFRMLPNVGFHIQNSFCGAKIHFSPQIYGANENFSPQNTFLSKKKQQPCHANDGYCDAINFIEIEDSTQSISH